MSIVFQAVLQLVTMIITVAFGTFFIGKFGATPGKMVTGTLVRLVEGPGRLSVATALRRQIISVCTSLMGLVPLLSIFGFGLSLVDPAWMLWDPKRQCLHDKLADTVVILRNPQS